jgi:branched-chain amino acid transport system permease protein
MLELLVILVSGLLLGGLYALVGFGLSVTLGVMRIINVAHGDFAILAGYLGLTFTTFLGLDPLVDIAVVAPIMFILGLLIQKYMLNRILQQGLNQVVILTFALGIAIENLLLLFYTPDAQSLTPQYMIKGINIGGIPVSLALLISFILAFVTFAVLYLFFKRTYIGKAMRAVPVDLEAAKMVGIKPEVVYNYAMALAMFVTGIAGILLGTVFTFYPYTGPGYLIAAFGVVLIGGLGNFLGTFIGGIALGEAMALGGYFFGATYQLMFCYLIILIIMLGRRQTS